MPNRPVAVSMAGVALIVTLAGFSQNKPPVCSNLDALAKSVSELRNIKLTTGALQTLTADLHQVQSDLKAVTAAAKNQFQPELSTVGQALSQLSAALSAATADPNSTTVTAVGSAAQQVGSAFETLQHSVSQTC